MKHFDFDIYNADKEREFTSTGEKIFCHPEVVRKLQDERKAQPVVMHIMPTENCNLKCIFCSVAQRDKYSDLPFELIQEVVGNLKKRGLKAVILSGGGEPLFYKDIKKLIFFLHNKDLEIGLITNGTLLARKLSKEDIKKFSWIRISINALDYLDDIEIPAIPSITTLGFSYIWNELTRSETLDRIKNKIKEIEKNGAHVEYVRLLPDCNLSSDDLIKAHEELRKITRRLGPPFFHQFKIHGCPSECHLGRLHPVLYTDRKIYPCDSLVLNSPKDDKKFHQEYAICDWNELDEFYDKKIEGSLIDTKKCLHCVFEKQNNILKAILDKVEIPSKNTDFKHKNFI